MSSYWKQPLSSCPLIALLLVDWPLEFPMFLQIAVHIFKCSAFWNPFIPISVSTITVYEVFPLFVLLALCTLCVLEKQSVKAQHSLTIIEFRL
ncbi:hypothetical protein I79_016937 [Cricetulus griseus]|uniref:Uncharacterized protein n=1 Tax=Cricetulus griseus TaxID=10029 RepID=G3I0P8_CRIGR|nr:hypothetical protein I79_016937 [Cricetulus griseus]